MIHNVTLYGSSILIMGLFVVVLSAFESHTPKRTSGSPRTQIEFCEEVADEVRLSQDIGLVTQAEADQINSNCLNTEHFND